MANLQDRRLICKDCTEEFTWTAGEQEFYAQKQLQEPKRCKPCRQAMREHHGEHRRK